jgi:TRAP-type C4-dicarboxylate transport system substrate-binding protein
VTRAAELIEERTDGKVQIDCHFGASLLKYPEALTGVSSGVAHISTFQQSIAPQAQKLHGILGLPLLKYPDLLSTTEFYREVLKKYPEFEEENRNLNVKELGMYAMGPYQLHMVTKAVTVPEDLKGMNIMGADYRVLVANAGGQSVQFGPPDWYMALDTGVADGQFLHWEAIRSFKTNEVFKYHTIFGEGSSCNTFGYIINLDTWESLSPDIQDIFEQAFNEASDEHLTNIFMPGNQAGIDEAKAMGHEFVEMETGDTLWEQWLQAELPHHEQVIEELEADGWPAEEIYQGMLELLERYW